MFRVVFFNQGKVYEIYAKTIQQADLFGFVEIGGLLFGETSKVLVDPSEERLKNEFQDVKRSLIPVHAIVRIDQVDKEGAGKIHDSTHSGNITPFPSGLYRPDPGPDKSR